MICRGCWDARHTDTRRYIGIALELGIAIYPVSCQSAPMMYVFPALLLLCFAGVPSIADEQCKVGEDSGYDDKIAICVKFHPMFSWWLQYIYTVYIGWAYSREILCEMDSETMEKTYQIIRVATHLNPISTGTISVVPVADVKIWLVGSAFFSTPCTDWRFSWSKQQKSHLFHLFSQCTNAIHPCFFCKYLELSSFRCRRIVVHEKLEKWNLGDRTDLFLGGGSQVPPLKVSSNKNICEKPQQKWQDFLDGSFQQNHRKPIRRITGWWFQKLYIFTPGWGNGPIWLIFFRWVETTN